jgi:GNAT superfamily N-acetyltransferase
MSSPAFRPGVQLRRATSEDADVCGLICYEAFTAINAHHNFPPEIPGPDAGVGLLRALFSHPGFYCIVAELDGRAVGSNCMDERSAIAGIGPVTVAPDFQDRGIGRMLMQGVIDRARERGFAGIRLLQSAFHSRSLSLYAKLGFDVREPVSVMQGLPLKRSVSGCLVRPATYADIDPANRLCERVHGHNRGGELRESIDGGAALVVERHNRMTGYASGFGYLGHAVGESNTDLQAMIAAADAFPGPGILIPERNPELFRWCLENGLRIVQPMTLMTLGLYSEPAGAWLPSILY